MSNENDNVNQMNKFILDFKIILNKRLYENGDISYEIYTAMTNKLIKNLKQVNI